MKGLPRPQLSYANVISTVCLFVVLSSSAYAAVRLPAKSIGTAQLKQTRWTGAKIKDRTITAPRSTSRTLGPVPTALSVADPADQRRLRGPPAPTQQHERRPPPTKPTSRTKAGLARKPRTPNSSISATRFRRAGRPGRLHRQSVLPAPPFFPSPACRRRR